LLHVPNTYDVLVVGGGFGGLATAGAAAELGARVAILESAPQPGGAATLSAGLAWTLGSPEEFEQLVPHGDLARGTILTREFPAAIEKLRQAGVAVGPLRAGPRTRGIAHRIDVDQALAAWRSAVLSHDGVIITRSHATSLIVGAHGEIIGVRASGPDADSEFQARAVVLATGGFQGNAELREKYFGSGARNILMRSSEFNVGDGLRMGLEAGATTSENMDRFYGHLVPHPLPHGVPEMDFNRITLDFSEFCLIVNERGERFTDESAGDPISNQRTLGQPGSRAFVIFDDVVIREHLVGVDLTDSWSYWAALGARVASANGVLGLVATLKGWGVSANGLANLLAERFGDDDRPEHSLYAIEAGPAVTLSHGGLAVDEDGRVLKAGGATIPGLFAVGADAGGLYDETYGGGLSVGLVFAPRVARAAYRP
jgi:succinate dehydrogenase/fumarate reductase flavoprotein subunit